MTKKLYWVQFIDQDNGMIIEKYILAYSLEHLENEISDIKQIRAIDRVEDYTEGYHAI